MCCREGCDMSAAVLLMRTLTCARRNQSTQSHERLDWLLQLMGLVKNFVTGRQSAGDDRQPEVCYFSLISTPLSCTSVGTTLN